MTDAQTNDNAGEPVAGWRAVTKRAIRRAVPHARRAQIRALYNRCTWPLYAGDRVRCNCCDHRFRRFRVYASDGGHRAFMCPRCGSLGRHRVDWLYLTTCTDLVARPMHILHIAPEVCLEAPLRRLQNVEYLSADYDSTLAMDRVDVTDIHYDDNSFDGIICNHVLQLVDDDRAAIGELFRVTRPGGWALLQSSVDMSRDHTIDEPETAPLADGARRYEEVFMRTYGRDYAARLEQAGYVVTVSQFAKDVPEPVLAELGLDIDETIFFCRKA